MSVASSLVWSGPRYTCCVLLCAVMRLVLESIKFVEVGWVGAVGRGAEDARRGGAWADEGPAGTGAG
eukprot:3586156-Rhodomonas_salina.2